MQIHVNEGSRSLHGYHDLVFELLKAQVACILMHTNVASVLTYGRSIAFRVLIFTSIGSSIAQEGNTKCWLALSIINRGKPILGKANFLNLDHKITIKTQNLSAILSGLTSVFHLEDFDESWLSRVCIYNCSTPSNMLVTFAYLLARSVIRWTSRTILLKGMWQFFPA